MLASTFFDPVLGIDTHIVLVPAPPSPSPIPTPVPLPFVGLVFDPLGLLVGAGIGMALGGGPGIVLINNLPATNCGTEVTNLMTCPHLPAPGVAFATGLPGNDAQLYFGALDVSLAGTLAVRFGEAALSCGDPIRLPTSVVMAVPKGCPVVILRPPVPDLMAIAMAIAMRAGMAALRGLVRRGARLMRALRRMQRASPRWTRVAQRLQRWVDNIAPRRVRARIKRGLCFLTGHPVDVATGRVLTDFTDLVLPGPLPLRFERYYDSSLSWRRGALGYGWAHSLEEAVWTERGKVVYRAEDGREVEFHLHERDGRTLRSGEEMFLPFEQLTLRRGEHGAWSVRTLDGVTREFRPVAGDTSGVARLVRRRDRNGNTIDVHYDRDGLLSRVRDSGGRDLVFTHDHERRLVAVAVPSPRGTGTYVHRRFRYDGDLLVEATDSLGESWSFEYASKLLVRETDRNGLSFYFQYDGHGSGARCIRTWGDNGIFDHVITYDIANMRTVVEDSLGGVRTYQLDTAGQVVADTDALGGTTTYEYDSASGRVAAVATPEGAVSRWQYDSRARLTSFQAPDGGRTAVLWVDDLDRPASIEGPLGEKSIFRYDGVGNVVERQSPDGTITELTWESGLLRSLATLGGVRTDIRYDEWRCPAALERDGVPLKLVRRDRLGNVVSVSTDPSNQTSVEWDTEGRTRVVEGPFEVSRFDYDAEGCVVRSQVGGRDAAYTYAGLRRLVRYQEAGRAVDAGYDTEGRLIAVANEAGERFALRRDRAGRVVEEVGFDGAKWSYARDRDGEVTEVRSPSGRYTSVGPDRIQSTEDGSLVHYEYDAAGRITRALNGSADIVLERDALGRVLAESQDGGETWVRSSFGIGAPRVAVQSDLGAFTRVLRDEGGRVAAVEYAGAGEPAGQRQVVDRDRLGKVETRSLPGGISVRCEHDARGRLTERLTTRARGSDAGPSQADVVVDARSYRWDGLRRLGAIIDAETGPTRYEHEARGRLVSSAAGGQRLLRLVDAVDNVYADESQDGRRYDSGGRLLESRESSFAYDEEGRRVRRVDADGSHWSYEWCGPLLAAVRRPDGSTVKFSYDAFGRRTRKLVESAGPDAAVVAETRFVWDGDDLLHEIEVGGRTRTWHYDPEVACPIAVDDGTEVLSVVVDHLGVPTDLYDERGERVVQMSLDIYGRASFTLGSTADCPWRWPGQYEDEETGLYYNRWRYYDPEVGSYLSPDPLGLAGGLRFYAYVADPLVGTDPFGLFDEFEVAPYGDSGHTGDKLDADELLGSVWLREHGYGSRSQYVGARNPAIAVDPVLHRQFSAAQAESQLHDPAYVRGQSALDNIAENAEIREPILARWLRERRGLSARQARTRARKHMARLTQAATEYAESLPRLQAEAEEMRARRRGGC
ncbi:MAG: DUF6531 domain-containing protein [Myxococcota bacterium]|nr:DUF6531 domain-containing protein [Myxococcota bacterium]